MRKAKLTQVFLTGLLPLMLLCVLLPGKSISADDGNVVIDAEYSASVRNEAVADARSEALRGALQKAVEQATGNLLTPGIIKEQASILKESIFLKADQYIQNYRLVSEKSYGGVYSLIVRVTVSLEGIKNDLGTLGLQKELPPGFPSAPVLVTVRGMKRYQDYVQFREFLKAGIKGVEEIRPRSMAWGAVSMEVSLPGGAAVLAVELANVKQFPIKAVMAGDNAIEVVFVR